MSEELHKRWGKNIRLQRQVKDKRDGRPEGEGMRAMAEALEVAPATVSRWETGKLIPRDGKKIDIAEYLGVPPELLFPLVREVSA